MLVAQLCIRAGVQGFPLAAPRPVHEVAMLCRQAQAYLHSQQALSIGSQLSKTSAGLQSESSV